MISLKKLNKNKNWRKKKMIRADQITLRNVWAYCQGNYRYILHYYCTWAYKILVRKHIREQIDARIASMDKQCLTQGFCKECGCNTTNLQHANKPCDGGCYPKMLNRKEWNKVKNGDYITIKIDGSTWSYGNTWRKFV